MIELDLAEKALFSNLLIKTNMLLPKIQKVIKKLKVASRVIVRIVRRVRL